MLLPCESSDGSSQSIVKDLEASSLIDVRDEILSFYGSSEVENPRGYGDFAWKVINKYAEHNEKNAQLWWYTTGPLLAVLLHEANYQPVAQCEILLFYFLVLAPQLGPHPGVSGELSRWKSFMTDQHLPLELSWDWGMGDRPPMVRLSIEPIALDAGTPQNALNQSATDEVVANFKHMFPNTELSMFHHFSKELLTYNAEHHDDDSALVTAGHQSRSFVAFDFGNAGPMLKAYFLPVFKARETRQSNLAVISQAIFRLAKIERLEFPGFNILSNYIRTSAEGARLEAEMLSIDCVSPAASRIKVYLRSQSTSFNSIRVNMTLDGALKHQGFDEGIAKLEQLWELVLRPARYASAEEELPYKAHRTAGILYYYEIRPAALTPIPRIYIPVRHYGANDAAVADGLLHYLKGRGQDETAGHYLRALQTA